MISLVNTQQLIHFPFCFCCCFYFLYVNKTSFRLLLRSSCRRTQFSCCYYCLQSTPVSSSHEPVTQERTTAAADPGGVEPATAPHPSAGEKDRLSTREPSVCTHPTFPRCTSLSSFTPFFPPVPLFALCFGRGSRSVAWQIAGLLLQTVVVMEVVPVAWDAWRCRRQEL